MGLIANEMVAQVLDRCDIVEVISSYIPLKRAGRNFKALCPFHHEKTSSFVVSPDKQIYHCFGCGAGGNSIGFVMQQERLEFPEAVRFLADKVGIVIPESNPQANQAFGLKQDIFKINELAVGYFHQNLLTNDGAPVKKAREYLKNRGVRLEDVKQFKLGFALDEWDGLFNFLKKQSVPLKLIERSGLVIPRDSGEGYYDRFRDRIVFPIFDVKSQCIGFGARTMKDDKGAKYINSPDTPVYTKGHHLFGLQLSRHAVIKKDFAIVVEGYMDMIIPFQNGVDNIVASLGTALTIEQIRLLRRYSNDVVMLYDADVAGQAAIVRSLDLLIEHDMNVKVAQLSVGEDPDTFIRKFGFDEFSVRISEAVSFFDFKVAWLIGQHGLETIESKTDICHGMLATLNKIVDGIKRDEYIKVLSQKLRISEEELKRKAEELRKKSTSNPREGLVTLFQSNDPKTYKEKYLLKLVLRYPESIALIKMQLTINDLSDAFVQRIFEKLFKASEESDLSDRKLILDNFTDTEDLKIISEILLEDIPEGFKFSQEVNQTVRKLKEDLLKNKKQGLSRQIEDAEKSGDFQLVNQLLIEKNKLLKTNV